MLSRLCGRPALRKRTGDTRITGHAGIFELPARAHQAAVAHRSSTISRRQTTVMRGTGQFFVGGNWKCNGEECDLQISRPQNAVAELSPLLSDPE